MAMETCCSSRCRRPKFPRVQLIPQRSVPQSFHTRSARSQNAAAGYLQRSHKGRMPNFLSLRRYFHKCCLDWQNLLCIVCKVVLCKLLYCGLHFVVWVRAFFIHYRPVSKFINMKIIDIYLSVSCVKYSMMSALFLFVRYFVLNIQT